MNQAVHRSTAISASAVELQMDGQSIIDHVTVDVQASEFVSILGPSGCGKTSLLRMIAGLQNPTSGRLELTDAACRPSIGYVFQDPTLLPWRTVVENVALPLELNGISSREAYSIATDRIKSVGLRDDDLAKFPKSLSGGMRMRVSLARAIVAQPSVMLFDEPFAALDDLLRSRLNEELLRLWSTDKWTGVFVTHNVSEAVFLSNRVIVLTDRPAKIQSIVDIPFPYPRAPELRNSREFNDLASQLTSMLRGDS